MTDPLRIEKAELRELDSEHDKEINPDRSLKVQFNPESMKLSFANQIQPPSGTGDQRGPQSMQFVGAGTTKLALTLWFDVTAAADHSSGLEDLPADQRDDVRRLTQKVAYFITPKGDGGDPETFVPPAVRFLWGTFQFDGIVESLEESLELFSHDGKPLRASVSLGITQQKIKAFAFAKLGGGGTGPGSPGSTPGARPLTPAPAGASVQSLAAQQGRADRWQEIAAANGIEDPRRLPAGALLDLSPARPGAARR